MSDDQSILRTELSCLACKRLKRKCSRQIPNCSLCQRTNRRCQYPNDSRLDDGSLVRKLQNQIKDLEAELSQFRDRESTAIQSLSLQVSPPTWPENLTTEVPKDQTLAALFLDSVACRNNESQFWRTIEGYLSEKPISPFSASKLQDLVQRYIQTTHVWFPVISVLRLQRLVDAGTTTLSIDVNLLFTALHMLHHCHDPDKTSVYSSVKRGLDDCHARGILTLNVLAAELIVSVFEIGHAIYPAAYMTTGKCIRLSYLLGLHDSRRAVQVLPIPDTWTEREERRRLWWAAIILDRCVTIGFRFRPLYTSFLSSDEALPACDDKFNSGEPSVNPLLIMSGPTSFSVAPFGKTCQAAHLLGRVIQHINYELNIKETDSDMHYTEAIQLHRTINSFLTDLKEYDGAAIAQKMSLLPSKALAYSALLNLYDIHCCIEGDLIKEQKRIATEVLALAKEVLELVVVEQLGAISPLVCECFYQAAAHFAWMVRETGSAAYLNALNVLRQVLQSIGMKWHVAESYLKLLEGTEYEWKGGCRF